jgi:cold shock CspA family protein
MPQADVRGGSWDKKDKVSIREEDFEPGIVKFVHSDGYGFITRAGKSDVYFHIARLDPDVVNRLKEGTPVEVAVGDGKRGPAALMLRLQ